MIDDQIRHYWSSGRDRLHVGPGSESRIDPRVVDRIESRVGSVDRIEEGQQVNAGERAFEGAVQEWHQVGKRPTRQPIHIRDELRLVGHAPGLSPGTAASSVQDVPAVPVAAQGVPSDGDGVAAASGAPTLRDRDRGVIVRTLKECNGNVSLAARKLRVSRGLIYRRLREPEPT